MLQLIASDITILLQYQNTRRNMFGFHIVESVATAKHELIHLFIYENGKTQRK